MNTPRGVVYHYMGPDLWTFFFLRLPSPVACGKDGKQEGESNVSGEKEEQMTKIEKEGKKAWT